MYLTTKTEVINRKLRHMTRTILVTRHLDVFRCEHCDREHQLLRLDGEARPVEPFYCLCNRLVSIN